MPTFFFFSISSVLLLLSCAPFRLTCTAIAAHHRRVLHQPFRSQDSLPPTQPPSPQPPHAKKYPFSTSKPSPQPPFFPSITSPPPPPSPPSPSNFASFPANISSLSLPKNPKSKSASSKLVAVAIVLVVSAVVVTAISLFLYVRRRKRQSFGDSKTYRSDNSLGVLPPNGLPKPRRSPPNSSEFLYLGTIVNSHGGVDAHVGPNNHGGGGGGGGGGGRDLNLKKMDSPELRPLPPLGQQNFQQNNTNAVEVSGGEEEDEEFYSPRGSSVGPESSIGTGSASRRAFAAVAAGNFDVRTSESSSSSSYSSNSGSPTRSVSLSISPPVSSSPRSSRPKSPDLMAVQTAPPPPPPPPSTQFANLTSSASPSPPSSSSPERASDKSLDSSPRTSNFSIQNAGSPVRINSVFTSQLNSNRNSRSPSLSPLSSPSRFLGKAQDSSPRISSVSNQMVESPAKISNATSNQFGNKRTFRSPSLSSLSSPEREGPVEKKIQDSSPRISNASSQNEESPAIISNIVLTQLDIERRSRSPSLSSLSTPEKPVEKTQDSSPRMSNLSLSKAQSPLRIRNSIKNPAPVSVVPPPPPPPPPPPAGHWETPVHTPSLLRKPILNPPVLVAPSRPVAIGSPTTISPIQLPPSSEDVEKTDETPKPKLKPLHWDKVRASSDREMVWDQLKSSSFKLNEEMIETLFVVNTPNSNQKESTRRQVLPSPSQENKVLDPKKAQNIAISLRALNVTIEEVYEALSEGNSDALGTEMLESLLKMAPTKDEERRLKEYKDDSPFKLGPAERFLKAVIDIPFAFKRVEAMLYMANFESEVEYLKKSFDTLEAACEELRSSRMFLKLLEAVLKTGNRMNVGTNRGDAQAFKLDTLLKLVDVKGADGKTTLLHFVVQEIIRSEGARLSDGNQNPKSSFNDDTKCRKLGLQVVSGLSSELANVKKAAAMDSDVLSGDVMKLSKGLGNIAEVVGLNQTTGSDGSSQKFSVSMNRFMKMAEEEIFRIQAQESVALSLVKEITEYFHGNSAKEEAHPFRIFMVVRDFLTVLDRVCREVGMINERTLVSSAHKFPVPVNPMLQPVSSGFPVKHHFSSSDDET